MAFRRRLDLVSEASRKSLFLFGPRQTGKTFLLREQFPKAPFYNLLLSDVFLKLSRRPAALREELAARPSAGPVIVDEVQKLPLLLDEIQHMISAGRRFILTGSSPRKLKGGHANLLGGRARTRRLFPLVSAEVPGFDMLRAVNFGALPPVYTSEEPWQDLLDYCGNYLKEEIQAEGLVRRVDHFARFLEVAALANGELVNFAAVASDAGHPVRTVREYFHILEDTLLATLLEPYAKHRTRKSVAAAKFYFFDVGVANVLAGRQGIKPKTDLFGKAFEHLVFTELAACLSYRKDERPLTFWRDKAGHEVDFLIGGETAIEVKGAELVADRHLKNLSVFSEAHPLKHKVVVSLESAPRRVGDVTILPWKDFLERLWDGDF